MNKREKVVFGVGAALLLVACGKAEIAEECTQNGFGAGSCSFTNKGDAAGALCGKIKLVRKSDNKSAETSSFCSGQIAKQSTVKVEYSLPQTRDLCVEPLTSPSATPDQAASNKSWTDLCEFGFQADKP